MYILVFLCSRIYIHIDCLFQLTTDVSEQRFRVPIRGFRYDEREGENRLIAEKQQVLIDAEKRLEKAINSGGTSHEKEAARFIHTCLNIHTHKNTNLYIYFLMIIFIFAHIDMLLVKRHRSYRSFHPIIN